MLIVSTYEVCSKMATTKGKAKGSGVNQTLFFDETNAASSRKWLGSDSGSAPSKKKISLLGFEFLANPMFSRIWCPVTLRP